MLTLIILLIMKLYIIIFLIFVLTFVVGCTAVFGILVFLLNYQSNPLYCILAEGLIVSVVCFYIWLIRVLRARLD